MSDSILSSLRRRAGLPELLPLLAEQLSLSELNSLLLDVFHRRAQRLSPAALLAAYRQNRFVRPSAVDAVAFRRFELLWMESARDRGFVPRELSPLAPLGSCSVVGTVHQHKVLSATRGTEVVADATNVLALESSVQRQAAAFPREPLQYCAVHRHVRTQSLHFPGFTPHFSVFCLTTAGRDTGHFEFERTQLTRHIDLYLNLLRDRLEQRQVKILLKALDPDQGENPLFEEIRDHFGMQFPQTEIAIERMPQSAQRYYQALQFGLLWEYRGHPYPIADGGFTSWTQQLTGNRKERFLSSGIGLELMWKLLNGML